MFAHLRQAIEEQPAMQGITILDVLQLPEPLGGLLKSLARRGPCPSSVLAAELAVTPDEMRVLGDMMIEKGLLTATEGEADGEIVYRVRLASAQSRRPSTNLLNWFENG